MHHVVGKARKTERFAPEVACESCDHYRRLGCGLNRMHWPYAGRRCKKYELRGPVPSDD